MRFVIDDIFALISTVALVINVYLVVNIHRELDDLYEFTYAEEIAPPAPEDDAPREASPSVGTDDTLPPGIVRTL